MLLAARAERRPVAQRDPRVVEEEARRVVEAERRSSRATPGTSPPAPVPTTPGSVRGEELAEQPAVAVEVRDELVAATSPPSRYAATDAAMPIGVGPGTSNTRQLAPARARRRGSIATTCAHFRPGEVERLRRRRHRDACAPPRRPTRSRTARGRCPGYTSGACTSSATTRAPCRSTIAASAPSSSVVNTRPVGLCGLHSSTARRPPRARRRWRRDRASRPPSRRIGAATTGAAGQLDHLEERRVRRRRDDDAAPRRRRTRRAPSRCRRARRPRGRSAPAARPTRTRLARKAAHAVVSSRRGRLRRSRSPRGRPRRAIAARTAGRDVEVHLRDPRGEHVGAVQRPLDRAAAAQPLDVDVVEAPRVIRRSWRT